MNRDLWTQPFAEVPTPTEFASYLRQRGWRLAASGDRWTSFERGVAGALPMGIDLPLRSRAGDYPAAARTVLENLARLEQRDVVQVLRDVKAVATDLVRVRVDGPLTRDGRIPVAAGYRLFEGARDMLLAAACSVDDPRPVYPQRKVAEAMALLRRARFGRPEVGSFVLTIECDVTPSLASTGFAVADADEPYERRTALRLAEAVRGTADAVREAIAVADIEPFARRVERGVSANLCEAIAVMLDVTDAELLQVGFAFASGRPVAGPSGAVGFEREALGPLREAAGQLRARNNILAVEVVGHVVRLESQAPEAGGVAVLHAEVEQVWRHIRVQLDGSAYQAAIVAHQGGRYVRCQGDVGKVGRAWQLTNPRGFDLLPAP